MALRTETHRLKLDQHRLDVLYSKQQTLDLLLKGVCAVDVPLEVYKVGQF